VRLRSLGPVWSRPNALAHGIPFAFPASPNTGPGIAAGTQLVRCCAQLGIAVDLSHLNEAGFWDVARLEAAP
jgi:membrane dipeptidase